MGVHQIGFIGVGKIGRALAQGLLHAFPTKSLRLHAHDIHADQLHRLCDAKNFVAEASNVDVVKHSEIILLCVKPFQARAVVDEISKYLKPEHLLISICASITLQQLDQWSHQSPRILRAMPNLPSLVASGMTVIAGGKRTSARELRLAKEIFASVGEVIELDEHLLDAVTAVSGSGPAFMFYVIESMAEAGVRLGIPKAEALKLVFHTMRGSAELCLQSSFDPAELIQQVATPGGCTIEGLRVLDSQNVKSILIQSIEKAAKRASELRIEE